MRGGCHGGKGPGLSGDGIGEEKKYECNKKKKKKMGGGGASRWGRVIWGPNLELGFKTTQGWRFEESAGEVNFTLHHSLVSWANESNHHLEIWATPLPFC